MWLFLALRHFASVQPTYSAPLSTLTNPQYISIPASVAAAASAAASAAAAPSSSEFVAPPSASPLDGLPPFALVLMALGCLSLAAAVAGLTLGLMSLDSTALDVVMKSKDPKQAEAARLIKPIRDQGNLLLVTLLLSNTLAAEFLPLVLDALVPGGVFSLVVSVLSLMIFGEMIPQAVCSRHPLYFGAKLIGFVKVLRIIMYPVARPISWALDAVLGEELGTVYTKDELKNLIDFHLTKEVLTLDETKILNGTLEFTGKTVDKIMTPIEKVFMLDIDAKLDRNTMIEILKCGYSRIPLYDTDRNNIVCLLLVKQLILVNPDESEPVQIRHLISNIQTNVKVRVAPTWECSESVAIVELLNSFQIGRSHMAMVYDDVSKPTNERVVLGIVTMEDIIEEILQEEIVDETDRYVDNTNKQPRLIANKHGRMVYSPPPGPSPSASIGQSVDDLSRPLRMREIDVSELRRPLLDSHSDIFASNGEPHFISPRTSTFQKHSTLSQPPSSSLASAAVAASERRHKNQQKLELQERHNYNPHQLRILPQPQHPQDNASLSEPSLDRLLPEQYQNHSEHDEEIDFEIHSGHAANGVNGTYSSPASVATSQAAISSGGYNSDAADRDALWQRNSADNLTGEGRSPTSSRRTTVTALFRRPSRMGPMLGGVARRSMMSLMGDDDGLLPEDIARAERQHLLRQQQQRQNQEEYGQQQHNTENKNQSTPRHVPKLHIPHKSRTPPADPRSTPFMRPVPIYAWAERTEIPSSYKRSNARRTDSGAKMTNFKPYTVKTLASYSESPSLQTPTQTQRNRNYGATDATMAAKDMSEELETDSDSAPETDPK